jgi:PAS domain S-box-containing protein
MTDRAPLGAADATDLEYVEGLRLRLALDAGRMGTWRWHVASGQVDWDERLEEIFGFAPGGFDGTYDAYLERLHPDERNEVQARVRQAVADVSAYDIEHRIVWPDGTVRWIQGRGDVTTDAAGTVTGTIGCVADITERKQYDVEREVQLRRSRLLAEVAAVIADSLSLDETLHGLAKLLVPSIADAAAIWLAGDGGPPRSAVVRHVDPAGEQALRALVDRYEQGLGGSFRTALNNGVLQVIDDLDDDLLSTMADEYRELLRECDVGAAVAVPIGRRRRVVGVLALGTLRGRKLENETIELAIEIAGRLPYAVENSVLYDSALAVASALQAGLAPTAPDDIPGVRVAVRYEAAGKGVDIGGDFYDFVAVAPDEHVLIVGDVCGRGPSAASLNAQVRFSARALARHGLRPDALADELNGIVNADAEDDRFCTAVIASIKPGPPLRVEAVTAGHPSPVVLRSSGAVEVFDVTGPLLGVIDRASYSSVEILLDPGDTFVALTDGLLEARNEAGAFFEPDLLPLLSGLVGRTAEDIASSITERLKAFVGGPLNDDLALVVIQPD